MIRRQLNAEETRIFAAGMAAQRRGEVNPSERLPPEVYFIWKEGWRRANRKKLFSSPHPSVAGSSRVKHGAHMIRTEVDDFDQALAIIAKQQATAKVAEKNRGRKASLRQEVELANNLTKIKKNRQQKKNALSVHSTAVSEMERRMVERVMAAIDMLTWSVNEMTDLSAIHTFYPQINRLSLIKTIERLCKLINRPVPEFAVAVRPPQAMRRQCINCAAELRPQDEKYCVLCLPADERIVSGRRLRLKAEETCQTIEDDDA